MRGHLSGPSGMGTSGLVSDLPVMVSFQTPGPFPPNFFSAANNSQQALEGGLWTPLCPLSAVETRAASALRRVGSTWAQTASPIPPCLFSKTPVLLAPWAPRLALVLPQHPAPPQGHRGVDGGTHFFPLPFQLLPQLLQGPLLLRVQGSLLSLLRSLHLFPELLQHLPAPLFQAGPLGLLQRLQLFSQPLQGSLLLSPGQKRRWGWVWALMLAGCGCREGRASGEAGRPGRRQPTLT